MKYIKFTAFLFCLLFVGNNAFAADQIIEMHLSGGTSVGSPSVFYMHKTLKKFCYDRECNNTLTQLSTIPTGNTPYVGSAIHGFPLIDRDGKIMINDFMFQTNIPESSYNVQNLFYSNQSIELRFGTNASPDHINLYTQAQGWINPDDGKQIQKLNTIPTSPGKTFGAFCTTENLGDDGSLIVVGGDGTILPHAESLSGVLTLFPLWIDVNPDVICNTGEYLPEDSNACTMCPENNWCPGGTFKESDTAQGLNYCGDGFTSGYGSDSSDDCTGTITCNAGEYLQAATNICQLCSSGYWCPGGAFTPNQAINQGLNSCEGKWSPPLGSDSEDDCILPEITCWPGEYLLPDFSLNCVGCPSNNWCPGGTFTFSPDTIQGLNSCGDGFTSGYGSDSSDDCIKSETILCNPGNFLPKNTLLCTPCSPNYWCPGGDFYQSDYEQGLNKCPEGTISPINSSSSENCVSPQQVTCAPGEYLPGYYSTCEVCPDYHWCPGGTYTESYQQAQGINWCGIGLYSSSGSDSNDDCINSGTILCNPGNFLKAGATSCSSCLANNWCPGGDFYQSDYEQGLNKCPAGTVCNFGQMEESSCHTPTTITCSAGNYLYYGKCEKCPKDTWCPGGDFTETYTSTEGLNKCSSGETSPEGSDSADDCKMLETINCPAGTWLPAFSSNCNICSKNYWCNGGSFYKNYSSDQGLAACTFGLISDEGSDEDSDCHEPDSGMVVCQPGNYLPANSETCSSCQSSHWCPGGVFSLDTLDQGTNICPNDGKSNDGMKSINSCYKDLLQIVIPHGTGDQTCYYGTAGYTENCKLNYVTSCDGGYYTENSAEKSSADKGYNTGCIVVGYNYYSPQGAFYRNACPGTKNGLKGETETETSSDINQCSITTIYTTGSGDVINGVGHTSCSYSETTKGYGIAEIMNHDPLILPKGPITDPLCSSNQKIVFCFGGYFLENDSGLECGPVGDGYYSPRPNYNEMTGCLTDDESNCTYQVDIDDYQSARGRETCPATYPHSELPRTSLKKCYKDCTLDVLNSVSVTPITSKIYYASGGKGEPEPVCKFNVECNTGYKAVDNGTEKPSCKLDGSVCQNDPNAVESDTNCIPTKCKDTYHLENKKCIENVVSCPIENGLGRKEWMKDNILGGKWTMCTAYQCNPGYTSKRYLTNETDEPCGECRNRRDTSGNIAVSAWKDDDCVIATCMYQGELYRLDSTGNKCVQICDTAGREDITGKMIWDPLSEKCERSCNPGFTNW